LLLHHPRARRSLSGSHVDHPAPRALSRKRSGFSSTAAHGSCLADQWPVPMRCQTSPDAAAPSRKQVGNDRHRPALREVPTVIGTDAAPFSTATSAGPDRGIRNPPHAVRRSSVRPDPNTPAHIAAHRPVNTSVRSCVQSRRKSVDCRDPASAGASPADKRRSTSSAVSKTGRTKMLQPTVSCTRLPPCTLRLRHSAENSKQTCHKHQGPEPSRQACPLRPPAPRGRSGRDNIKHLRPVLVLGWESCGLWDSVETASGRLQEVRSVDHFNWQHNSACRKF